jgi:hypothetical protein
LPPLFLPVYCLSPATPSPPGLRSCTHTPICTKRARFVHVGVYSPLLLTRPHLRHTVTHHPHWRPACTLGITKRAPVACFKCLGCKLAIVDLISHLPRGQHAWWWPAHTHACNTSTHACSFWHRRCVLAASAHFTGPAHTPEWPAHTHMHETSSFCACGCVLTPTTSRLHFWPMVTLSHALAASLHLRRDKASTYCSFRVSRV